MNLAVITYAYDSRSMLFAHQVEIVESLSPNFSLIFVLTRESNLDSKFAAPSNVRVLTCPPQLRMQFLYFFWINFQLVYLRFFCKVRTVFSHMTETSSLYIAFSARILGVYHVLWYAHTSRPLRLRLVTFFVNRILTSTKGSFPIRTWKVSAIGQAIDTTLFVPSTFRDFSKSTRFIHIGRVDPSKNIHEIISLFLQLDLFATGHTLTIVGEPSSRHHSDYFNFLRNQYSELLLNGSLVFSGKIERNRIPSTIQNFDCFVHAFQGSLDKVLVESALLGLPIVSINGEFLREFGCWTEQSNINLELESELRSYLKSSTSERATLTQNRLEIAKANHSLVSWSKKVVTLLERENLSISASQDDDSVH